MCYKYYHFAYHDRYDNMLRLLVSCQLYHFHIITLSLLFSENYNENNVAYLRHLC